MIEKLRRIPSELDIADNVAPTSHTFIAFQFSSNFVVSQVIIANGSDMLCAIGSYLNKNQLDRC